MSSIDHEDRADFVGDLPKPLIIESPRIGRVAGKHDLRVVLASQSTHLFHVDELGDGIDAIGDKVVVEPGEVDGRTMGEMAAVVESHPQHGVSRLEQGEVDSHVGLRSRVGLDVDVLGAKQLLGAVNSQLLHFVDHLTALVVTATRITLGILVGEDRTRRRHDCW